jgi:hypothetical protein
MPESGDHIAGLQDDKVCRVGPGNATLGVEMLKLAADKNQVVRTLALKWLRSGVAARDGDVAEMLSLALRRHLKYKFVPSAIFVVVGTSTACEPVTAEGRIHGVRSSCQSANVEALAPFRGKTQDTSVLAATSPVAVRSNTRYGNDERVRDGCMQALDMGILLSAPRISDDAAAFTGGARDDTGLKRMDTVAVEFPCTVPRGWASFAKSTRIEWSTSPTNLHAGQCCRVGQVGVGANRSDGLYHWAVT